MSCGVAGRALLTLGVVLSLGGCAMRGNDDRGMALELEIARLRAAEQRQHVAELEERLARLEKSAPSAAAEGPEVLARLDRLIALNEEVLMQSVARPDVEPSTEGPLRAASAPNCDPSLTPEEQLQRLVARIRGRQSTWRGGLSREEAEALRVLLRPERSLDAENPLKHW